MYHSDDPISDPKDDRLERSSFVGQLTKSILSWRANRSLVLALYGSWGTGKSSLLNLLRKELVKSSTSIAIADFDPWFFNSTEQLLRSFWEIFIAKAQPILQADERKRDRFKNLIHRYANSLTFTPELTIGILKLKIPVNTDPESPQDIKNNLTESLMSANGKLIFLIDNLDRLDAQELVLILKLIRLCSDLPNTIYVLAFDKVHVENILKEKKDIDAEYLDKIIQVDANLPSIDKAQLERIFLEGLDNTLQENKIQVEEDFSERFRSVFQKEIITHILTDIRRIKRYLNGLNFSLPLVIGEVNYTDLILLEFIRIFSPKTYINIPNIKPDLVAFDSVSFSGSDSGRSKRHDRYKKVINEIEQNNQYSDMTKSVLGELFPVFGAYLSNPMNPAYITYDYLGREADRELRIASPRHFDTYFRLMVPSSEISTSQIKQQIDRINDMALKQASHEVEDYFVGLHNENQFTKVLNRLDVHSGGFTQNGKSFVIRQLSRIADRLSWESESIFGRSEISSLTFFIESCLASERDPDFVNEVLQYVVSETPSLSFACNISGSLLKNAPRKWLISDSFNGEEIIAIVKKRIRNELIKPGENIFEKYPDSYHRIFSFWQSKELMNEELEARSYRDGLLSKFPEYIPPILGSYLWLDSSSEPTELNYSDLKLAYDVDYLYKNLKHANIERVENLKNDFALKNFVRLYEDEKKIQAPEVIE
jgi:hypothetical protein